MRNQQCWLLPLLGLGILAFPQIAAVSYDVARSAYDIVNQTISDVNENACFESFYYAMMNATEDYQNENGSDSSTLSNLTQEFLLCILTSAGSKPEPNPDAPEDLEIPDSQDQSATHYMGKMKNDMSSEAIDQIEDFENQPNYDTLNEKLLGQLHMELKKFLQEGLDQQYKQENYVNLIKKMLYVASVTIFSGDLIPGVNAAIDKRLEPYILEVIINQSEPSRMFSKKSKKPKIMKLENGQLAAPPDCDSEEFEPTFKCVYNYVVGLVKLEKSHTLDTDADQIWEPFSTKLRENLERLLIKIIEQTPSRKYSEKYKATSLQKVFRVRSSIISCLDLLREKYDVESLGIVVSGAEIEAINECMKSAKKQARNLIDYFTILEGMGRIDPRFVFSLDRNAIKEMVTDVMTFYPGLRGLRYFVRRQIKEGTLTRNDNSEESFTEKVIREWKESSIQDVNLRFATLFGDRIGLSQNCRLNYGEAITGYTLVTHDCWRSVLGDLLSIESVIHKDGLSLDVVFYQHPIVMNFMYIARQELSTCIPVKKTARISPPYPDTIRPILEELRRRPRLRRELSGKE